MNRIIKITITVLLVSLFACNEVRKSDSDITMRQWYYADGTLKKEMEYINDSIPHGTYKFFYPSGVLQDSAQLTKNKFHGKRFEYHENGKIYILTSYINNRYRNAIDYRLDGTLEYYRAYNYHEKLMFIIHYNTNGVPEKYDGNLIFSWVQEKEYPLREEFCIELLVAAPPNCKSQVLISDWNSGVRQAVNKKTYTPDEFNRVKYKRRQNPEKDLCILHIATINDTITHVTKSDTLIIKILKDGKSTYSRELN
jgi:hypothetical protein